MADPTVLVPASFDLLWSAGLVAIGIGAVVVVVLVVRSTGRLVRHGIDPTTVDAELAARLLQSQALAPARGGHGGSGRGPQRRGAARRARRAARPRRDQRGRAGRGQGAGPGGPL